MLGLDCAASEFYKDGQYVLAGEGGLQLTASAWAVRMDKSAGSGKVRVFIELLPNKRYNLQQVFFKEDNFFVLIINAAQD